MRLRWTVFINIMLMLWIQMSGSVAAQDGKVTAFVNVNLVPMTDATIIPAQSLLLRGERIIAISPSSTQDIPEDSIVIDGSNAYLMPGLADMHVHTDTQWLSGRWPVSPLDLFLANGVTTIRDFGPKGSPPDHALYWRNDIKAGRFRGPILYAAGPILYGPMDNAAEIVRAQKKKGFDFVKLYSFLSATAFHDAIATAQKLNQYTVGHIPFAVGLDDALLAGMNEIAHIEELDFEFLHFDRTRTLGHAEWFRYILQTAREQLDPLGKLTFDELKLKYQTQIKKIVQKLAESKTPISTTLTVDDVVVKKLFHLDRLVSQTTSQYLPYGFIESLHQGKNRHQIQFKGHEDFAPFHFQLNQLLLRELHDGGVTLVLGTDAGGMSMGLVPGFSLHDELGIMIKNGFTPYEAIRTATVNAAAVIDKMNATGDFGTLEVGKRADLLLIDGDPFDDINNLKNIQGVMASGRWYDKSALQRMIHPQIPVTAAVKHVYQQDKAHYTHLDVVIGKSYSGALPGAIDTIAVTGPNGRLPIEKKDFTYLRQLRDFWIKIPGMPQIGTYTIEVTSGRKTGSAADIQAVVKTIPLPDVKSYLPSSGAVLKSNNPTFAWKALKTGTPMYYRLEINEIDGGRVYATGYINGMRSHTVPKGLLKSGQSYRWRIRIADNDSWESVQNRSQSAWRNVHIR